MGRTVLAGVIALGLAVGAAAAVNASSLGSDGRGGMGPGGGAMRFGPGGVTMGTAAGVNGSLHGEFVIADGASGYTTIRTQSGEVTAVDADSVTVRSVDGFSATYLVADDTVIGGGAADFDSIDVGDTVGVTATVPDGTASDATATSIDEGTAGAQGQGLQPGGTGGQNGQPQNSQPQNGLPQTGQSQNRGWDGGPQDGGSGGGLPPGAPSLGGPSAQQTALVPSAARLEGGRGGADTGTAIATGA